MQAEGSVFIYLFPFLDHFFIVLSPLTKTKLLTLASKLSPTGTLRQALTRCFSFADPVVTWPKIVLTMVKEFKFKSIII